MLPLIMAACGAAGAVAGALTTHAAKEKDRQAVKRYEKVNAELINSRDKLQKQYYELSDRSKKQINDLNLKLAESEMEKDLVYLALSLYHELMALREDIDINPSFEVLVEFHKAILLTNYVLKQLDKHLVPVSQDYFSRTLNRIDERDNLSKEQLFSFMAVLMNPQQDTVTSILGEVQNEMFSQQTIEVEQQEINSLNLESEDIVNDNSAEFWSQQAEKFFDAEEYEQALVCLDKAIAVDSNNDEFWYGLSLCLFFIDRKEEALESFEKAIAINPDNGEYWYGRSRALLDLFKKQEALESLERAITIEPDNDEYRKLRSEIELDSVKNSGNQEVFEKVKKIVVEQLEVEENSVTPKASFAEDLGADSLDTVELVIALEEEFDLEISDKAAEQVDTVGKAVKLIAATLEY